MESRFFFFQLDCKLHKGKHSAFYDSVFDAKLNV